MSPDATDRGDTLAAALADRYRVERELGAGGMATVYLAHDRKHDRPVAIKVLRPELAAVLGADRFVQEIHTTAQLQHPNILPLFDSGAADGFLYYVMPYVDGESLRDRLNRDTQLGIEESVKLAGEAADALQYAHEHGVVHRDIKPENILLHAGRPIVADFGIALAVSAAAGGRMTETGLSLGTPHYMSPEQATAEKTITNRSDIYSLGATLYEMLTGNPPHTGASAQQIIMKIVTEEAAPVTTLRRSVPPNVAAAVATALEKLPADRFATARDFAAALGDPRYTRPIGAGRATSAAAVAGWKRLALGAAAATLALAAMAAWEWLRPPATTAPSVAWRIPIALADSQAPVNAGVAISPDGSTIVYPGAGQLYRLTAATGRAEPIPGTQGGYYPGLSPDGRRVAYYAGHADSVVVQSLDGGTRTTVPSGIGGTAAWLDDEHLLLAGGADGVLLVPTNGAAPVRLTKQDSELTVVGTAPLPPGDGVLFTGLDNGPDSLRLWIGAVNLHGGKPVRLTRGDWARFVSPSHLIVSRDDGTIAAFPFDPKRLRITGPATPIVHGGEFDVAAAGRMVYLEVNETRRQSAQIVWVDRRGAATALGSPWPGSLRAVALAADGSRIGAKLGQPAAEIRIRDVATGAVSRITSTALIGSIAWAPDGRALFYDAGLPSGSGIYRAVPGTAGGPEEVLRMPHDSAVHNPMPSMDGHTLYFDQYISNTTSEIRSVSLPGHSSLRVVVPAPAWNPVPSPDGRWLAYLAGDRRTADRRSDSLMVRSTDPARGEVWPVATAVESAPRWSRDGKALYFIAGDSMRVATVVSGADFRIASERALFPLGNLQRLFDVASDGRFVMVRPLADSTSALASANHLVMLENWARVSP